jgi:hypothetical protein
MSANNGNFDIWCPFCAPRDRSKKKLSIRTDNDANHCWTCDWRSRSLLPLFQKLGMKTAAMEYVEKYLAISDAEKRKKCLTINDGIEERPFTLPNDFQLMAAPGAFDPDRLASTRYALEVRNLSERDLWYFKLGTSRDLKWHRRVLMPSFDKDGNLNYMVGRAIDKKSWKKYDAPPIDKRPLIFNEINIDWSKQLVLCEGPFDLVSCGDNATPLLGSRVNEQSLLFEMILIHKTPIALALDADMLETKTPMIAKKFQEYDIDVTIVDVSAYGKNDPGEMSKGEFADALANASSPDWYSRFKNKLSIASKTSLTIT